ncbi:translation initiation factor IF-2 [Anaeropeptidivorans aminofermentans]|uniref:translation initiation factor IF-2 n=1 Tax=Anaeropeptidivorans aminofermentans TaxID=2934315 RepID=UPI002023DE71|nr:translation initiation factor IF-2 [Anaeropeptidivorans aminofermentans]
MSKIRVHELAKELNISSKELLNCIERLGIKDKKPASNLDVNEINTVKDFFKNASSGASKPQPAKEEPKPRPAENQQHHQQNRPSEGRSYQQRQGASNQGQDRGQRRPSPQGNQGQGQNQGQNRSYQDRNQGYNNNRYSQDRPRPAGTGQSGQQRSYSQNQGTQQRSYSQNQGQGQPRQEGTQGQRPYNNQGQRPQRPYQDRPRPNDQSRPQDGRTPYQGQNRRPYTPSSDGGKDQGKDQPYGQRRPQQGGFQRPGGAPKSSKTELVTAAKPNQKDPQKGLKRHEKNKDPKDKFFEEKTEPKAEVVLKKPAPKLVAKPKTNPKKNAKREKKKLLQAQRELEEAKMLEEDNEEIKIIQIGKSITVKDLADKMKRPTSDIIKPLMKIGIMATINQEVDFYTASNIAESFDIIVEPADEIDILEEAFKEDEDDDANLVERPPVVVVMGHVDHGKTSLLDSIRKSHVTEGEAGGITQHIGAYTVNINNKPITFLDTPGHEAFTAMRMRGAQVTDIAILVVAADDGVMPQTIEAINHAKAANLEIIVAINKIDKPSANPDRVKQELTEYGILTEDWGGSTICVPVSATQKTGIDQLLEMILLVAEIRELKANPNKRARGTVIEAKLDKGRGPVATVLVQDGSLKIGDPIVIGSCYGRIRAMTDDKGTRVKKVGPSIPVEIIGLNDVPMAGDMFYVAQSERHARQVSESVHAQGREDMIKNTPQKVSLDDLFNQIKSGNVKELNIIIKADVQGSVEAVKNSLERLSNDEVRIRTIHGGVGAITESDVMLASASNAIIIGFNVRPENMAKSVADAEKVDMRLYRIIYNAIEDITTAMKGLLDPVFKEKVTGHAEIRQLFKASGVGTIGGSYVTDGKIARNSKVRIVRNGIVVHEGELGALKRFKDDVKEVNTGYECGLSFNNFNDIKEGDIVEAYIMEEIPR